MKLQAHYLSAINTVRDYSNSRKAIARKKIDKIVKDLNLSYADFDKAVESIRQHGRVCVHFHPDRINREGQSVAELLLSDGFYKNQFETFISNGKLDPKIGGSRDEWENKMFGDAYGSSVSLSERPKYGSLNLMLSPDGSSPRFGSTYIVLKPSILKRSTFTYLDSYLCPEERGTIDSFDEIIASMFVDSFEKNLCLGVSINPLELIEHLNDNLFRSFQNPRDKMPIRNLDSYIETQIHGPIDLQTDAEILVTDPCFDGTKTELNLKQISDKFDLKFYKHRGFSLLDQDVPSDFRGETMPSLAKRISVNGIINAKIIGEAAVDVVTNYQYWSDRGSYEEVIAVAKSICRKDELAYI